MELLNPWGRGRWIAEEIKRAMNAGAIAGPCSLAWGQTRFDGFPKNLLNFSP